eukprot:snap_masked-scaffold_6-processed-gene-14.37-mRNA-1 protein AED:0.32 eAED:0.32 QI:0/-1/0/1/-1/1/1/0/210
MNGSRVLLKRSLTYKVDKRIFGAVKKESFADEKYSELLSSQRSRRGRGGFDINKFQNLPSEEAQEEVDKLNEEIGDFVGRVLKNAKPISFSENYDPLKLMRPQSSDEQQTFVPFRKSRKKPKELIKTGKEFHPVNAECLSQFTSEGGRILGRNQTGLNAKQQRKLKRAVKRSRHMGVLPYLYNFNPNILQRGLEPPAEYEEDAKTDSRIA